MILWFKTRQSRWIYPLNYITGKKQLCSHIKQKVKGHICQELPDHLQLDFRSTFCSYNQKPVVMCEDKPNWWMIKALGLLFNCSALWIKSQHHRARGKSFIESPVYRKHQKNSQAQVLLSDSSYFPSMRNLHLPRAAQQESKSLGCVLSLLSDSKLTEHTLLDTINPCLSLRTTASSPKGRNFLPFITIITVLNLLWQKVLVSNTKSSMITSSSCFFGEKE